MKRVKKKIKVFSKYLIPVNFRRRRQYLHITLTRLALIRTHVYTDYYNKASKAHFHCCFKIGKLSFMCLCVHDNAAYQSSQRLTLVTPKCNDTG
jgi:hypothetical protein